MLAIHAWVARRARGSGRSWRTRGTWWPIDWRWGGFGCSSGSRGCSCCGGCRWCRRSWRSCCGHFFGVDARRGHRGCPSLLIRPNESTLYCKEPEVDGTSYFMPKVHHDWPKYSTPIFMIGLIMQHYQSLLNIYHKFWGNKMWSRK